MRNRRSSRGFLDLTAVVAVCSVALAVNARCQLRVLGDLPIGGSLSRLGPPWRIYDEGYLLSVVLGFAEPPRPADGVGEVRVGVPTSRIHVD